MTDRCVCLASSRTASTGGGATAVDLVVASPKRRIAQDGRHFFLQKFWKHSMAN